MIRNRLGVERLEDRANPGATPGNPFAGAHELDIQDAPALHLQPPGMTASISGVVTDYATNAPLLGATITLTKLTGVAATFTTTTNRDGSYSLTGLPPGPYSITVEMPGYGSQGATVLEINAHNTSLDFAIRSSGV
jgi:hypothetical protein